MLHASLIPCINALHCVLCSGKCAAGRNTDTADTMLTCHTADLIQASLLVCGIMTAVQVTGIPLGRLKYKLGAGMLSVMGVSFASVPVATSTVTQLVVGVMAVLMGYEACRAGAYKKLYVGLLGCCIW